IFIRTLGCKRPIPRFGRQTSQIGHPQGVSLLNNNLAIQPQGVTGASGVMDSFERLEEAQRLLKVEAREAKIGGASLSIGCIKYIGAASIEYAQTVERLPALPGQV